MQQNQMFSLLGQCRKTPEQTQSAIFKLKILSSFQKTAKKTSRNELKKA